MNHSLQRNEIRSNGRPKFLHLIVSECLISKNWCYFNIFAEDIHTYVPNTVTVVECLEIQNLDPPEISENFKRSELKSNAL